MKLTGIKLEKIKYDYHLKMFKGDVRLGLWRAPDHSAHRGGLGNEIRISLFAAGDPQSSFESVEAAILSEAKTLLQMGVDALDGSYPQLAETARRNLDQWNDLDAEKPLP